MAKKKKTVKKKSSKKQLAKLITEEKKIIKEEKKIEEIEKKELEKLKRIEIEEKKIEEMVKKHPLSKITKKDIAKAFVGASLGIVAHFVFVEGVHIAKGIDVFRATLILLFAYVLGNLIIYYIGFREVKQTKLMNFLPLRATVVFATTITTILIILYIFGYITHETSLLELYKNIAVISLPANIGASALDLLGKET